MRRKGGLPQRWMMAGGFSFVLIAVSAHDIQDGIERNDCEQHTISETASPDGAWVATVDEAFCQIAPIGGANLLVVVGLARTDSPFRQARLLVGYDINRPHVMWAAPDILQVIVNDRSLIDRIPRQVGRVQIDPKFEPRP